MKQIGIGLQMYTQDYDETMPLAFAVIAPINGGTSTTIPYDQQLKPYVKNDQVYACPSDGQPRSGGVFWDGSYASKNLSRSYGYVGQIHTNSGAPDTNTGMSVWGGTAPQATALGDITAPSETTSIVELWSSISGTSDSLVGSSPGSLFTNCDTYKLAGRKVGSAAPIDQAPTLGGCSSIYQSTTYKPMPGHQDQGNYIFADGHAKVMRWGNVRTNDFYLFKLKKPTTVVTP